MQKEQNTKINVRYCDFCGKELEDKNTGRFSIGTLLDYQTDFEDALFHFDMCKDCANALSTYFWRIMRQHYIPERYDDCRRREGYLALLKTIVSNIREEDD